MTRPAPGGPAGPIPDPQLDFFSRSFNPYRALATAGLAPPLPAARPLDSIYRCRFMLPEDHPDAWREEQRPVKSKVGRGAAQLRNEAARADRCKAVVHMVRCASCRFGINASSHLGMATDG